MFFEPVKWDKGKQICISRDAVLTGIDGYAAEVIRSGISQYGCSEGIRKIAAVHSEEAAKEAYRLDISEKEICLTYREAVGLIYDSVTILQLLEHHELCTGVLYDERTVNFAGIGCIFRAETRLIRSMRWWIFWRIINIIIFLWKSAARWNTNGIRRLMKRGEHLQRRRIAIPDALLKFRMDTTGKKIRFIPIMPKVIY